MIGFWSATAAGPHVRRFHDGARLWSVWEVTPELLMDMGVPHGALADDLHGGWLCFQRGSERRRFRPLPPGWQHLSDDQLAMLCRRASDVRGEGGGQVSVQDLAQRDAARQGLAPQDLAQEDLAQRQELGAG